MVNDIDAVRWLTLLTRYDGPHDVGGAKGELYNSIIRKIKPLLVI